MTTHRTARLLSSAAVLSLTAGGIAAVAVPAMAAGKVTHCPAAALKVSVQGGDAGLSHRAYQLVFTNVSKTTCTLTGYPHVSILNAAGKVVANATRTPAGYLGGVSKIAKVTLAPKKSASTYLEGLAIHPDGDGCAAEPTIRLSSPQTFTLVRLKAATAICTDIEVHPVAAGIKQL